MPRSLMQLRDNPVLFVLTVCGWANLCCGVSAFADLSTLPVWRICCIAWMTLWMRGDLRKEDCFGLY